MQRGHRGRLISKPFCHLARRAQTTSVARPEISSFAGMTPALLFSGPQRRSFEFGASLGGSRAPPSFWEVPGLPRKFPELPRKFFGDFSGSSLTMELNSNPEVPRKFPKLPRKFPRLPRKFPDFPEGSPCLWEAWHPLLTHKNFLCPQIRSFCGFFLLSFVNEVPEGHQPRGTTS